MDTYVMVVCYWRSKVKNSNAKAKVVGASVGVRDFAIDVDIIIED